MKISEQNWLSFRRRTLKKIDDMKKKAELIKKKKTEKRDKKVKRVIEKLKSKERKRAGKLPKKQTNKKSKIKSMRYNIANFFFYMKKKSDIVCI